MVSINPSDPDSRGISTSVTSPAASRELPHEPELVTAPTTMPGTRGWAWPMGGVPWGAIIGGSLTAISILMLSSAFAVACGVPAYSGGAYGWGAGFWSVISAIIAFFCGAAVAGVVRPRERMGGALRGLLTWALTIPLILLISTSSLGILHGPVGVATPAIGVQGAAFTTASAMGAAWGTFISMLLGLVAAVIGGGFGEVSCSRMSASK